jgi:hypothetical protein
MSSSDDDVDEAILLCEGGGHSKSRRAKARAKARRGAPAAALPPPPAPSLPPGVTLEYEAAPVEGALGAFVGACAGDDPALAGVLAAFRRAAGVEEGEGGRTALAAPRRTSPVASRASSGARCCRTL